MSSPAAAPKLEPLAAGDPAEVARTAAKLWWVWVLVGAAWIVASLVILQFDEASIATIGYLAGAMFMFSGIQQLVLASLGAPLRWLWAVFGVLFLAAGAVCLANPEKTFVGLADILGFLYLMVGLWWVVRAFVERELNPAWWAGLIGGIAMIVLAFITSGQFFIEKAYALLAFTGIWAMLHGIMDIVRAFQVRKLHEAIEAGDG